MVPGGENTAAVSVARRGRSSGNLIAWVWITGALLVALVLGAGGWSLWLVYDGERREAIQSVSNLSQSVAGQLGAMVRNADAYLASTVTLAEFDDDGRLVNADKIHRVLVDWQARVFPVGVMAVVDPHGRRLVDSRTAEAGPPPYVPRDTGMRFMSAMAGGTFEISNPIYDQVSGQRIIVLRRLIVRPDGRLLGAVEMVVQIAGLARLFSNYDVGPEGSISLILVDTDGRTRLVLARAPYDEAQVGRSFQTTPRARERYSTDSMEVYFGPGFVDGIPRLFASRRIEGYAILVTVGTVWRDIIDRWYKVAPEILVAIVGAIGFVGILMFALAWQIGRRLRSEQRLSATLGELADRRRGELEAQQSKLDALARMSGGVAHEFSNLLQPITTLSDLGRKAATLGTPTPTVQYFERIGTAARQAVAIAGDFLTFCGTSQRRGYVAELRPALLAAVQQVQPLLPERCRLDVSANAGLRAYFDEVGLVQIVTNLVKNSIEAWQRSPAAPLRIAVTAQTLPDGHGVELRFADDGPGMTEAVRARIFEPFFTTKGATGGTGLGLSVIYGVVTSWGGRIDVQSRPGHGTATVIELRNSEEGNKDERPESGAAESRAA